MTPPQDRRFEPRSPANTRAVVVAPGLELTCLLVDQSAQGGRIRLDRNLVLPKVVMVIDIAQGVAIEAQVAAYEEWLRRKLLREEELADLAARQRETEPRGKMLPILPASVAAGSAAEPITAACRV